MTVYKAIVLPFLLYGSETWPTLAHHINRLEVSHQRHRRQIINVKWWQHVINTQILNRANSTTIEALVCSNRLRSLENSKTSLIRKLKMGKLSRGRLRKRWKDCAKEDLQLFGVEQRKKKAPKESPIVDPTGTIMNERI